jgi:hypothetical protein
MFTLDETNLKKIACLDKINLHLISFQKNSYYKGKA